MQQGQMVQNNQRSMRHDGNFQLDRWHMSLEESYQHSSCSPFVLHPNMVPRAHYSHYFSLRVTIQPLTANTSTKARIFPQRFSTFLTFWCKIRCNRNEASLYPCLSIAVSMLGLLDIAVSTPKLLDVAISTPNCLYSDDTVFCWLFTTVKLYTWLYHRWLYTWFVWVIRPLIFYMNLNVHGFCCWSNVYLMSWS